MTQPRRIEYGIPTMMQIRADKVIGYHGFKHSRKHIEFLTVKAKKSELRKKAYCGVLSFGARRRLMKALQIMACVTPERRMIHPVTQNWFKFRVAFVTLTFPMDLTENFEKQVPQLFIKPILQVLVRQFEVRNYVWRAERTKQGRVHLHIMIDQPINYQHLRNSWNRLLRKHGQLNDFASKEGHYNANSTDIRKVRNLKQALKYTSKYMSKEDKDSKAIGFKVWGCSSFLSLANWDSLEVGRDCWSDILQGLTGLEDGVLIADRFVCVANRYLKEVESTRNWLFASFKDWVYRMRVRSRWYVDNFEAAVERVVSEVSEKIVDVVRYQEFEQLQFMFSEFKLSKSV